MPLENDFTRVFGAIKEIEERVEQLELGDPDLCDMLADENLTLNDDIVDLIDENDQLRFILSILAAVKDDGWIEWHGGECPVSKDIRVDIKTRASGHIYSGDLGGEYYWHQSGRPNDIIAYRIAR
jgi:hypothetical protein